MMSLRFLICRGMNYALSSRTLRGGSDMMIMFGTSFKRELDRISILFSLREIMGVNHRLISDIAYR